MKSLGAAALALAVCSTLSLPARGQNTAFGDTLRKNRAAIGVHDGKLAGPGADILRAALADTQFVLLGEDHGIQQIPQFTASLCAELAPQGFHTMALETGPIVTPEIERMARGANGLKEMAEFDKRYPESVAFYNWREEFEMLQQCEKSAGAEGMQLWGLDQELMGAPVFVLEKILATKPGPEAQVAVAALLKENNEDRAAAAKDGNPEGLFLLKTKQSDLDHARALLKKQGSPQAQEYFSALVVSREIYQKNISGDGYKSNRQRALLMKENYVDRLTAAFQKEGAPRKVLFKFGAWHMYHGINPLHSSELGNLVGESAEGHQEKAIHILILGMKGEQLRFAGIGRPAQPVPLDLAGDKDSDFLFLKPLFDNQVENLWTIYDLRALREHFAKYGSVDPELERVIFGYDFAVLIPNPKPSHPVE